MANTIKEAVDEFKSEMKDIWDSMTWQERLKVRVGIFVYNYFMRHLWSIEIRIKSRLAMRKMKKELTKK